MEKTFTKHDTVVSEDIMEIMRQRRFLEEDDTSEDEDILSMSGYDFLFDWLEWEGIIGYIDEILKIIEMAYGIDLCEWPFNETIKRELGD